MSAFRMLDAVATIILAGMMFIPIINLVVGILAGASMFGFPGGIAGAAVAFLITIAQKQIPWRRPIHIKLGARIIDFPSRPTAAVL
jgi:predicted membrane protein